MTTVGGLALLSAHEAKHERLRITADGVKVELAVVRRLGYLTPILFLHGWGSSKEDYTDIRLLPELDGRPFIAYDAPGCGDSWCEDLSKVDIPFLVKISQAVLDHYQVSSYHLVGHSMGGLTALQLAHLHPDSVRSFVDIKGNLAPEDCFISRQVVARDQKDMPTFLEQFIKACREAPFFSSAIYAASIKQKVHIEAAKGILESMVNLSDATDLLSIFLELPCPKIFMFGEQHAGLSYLPKLRTAGVELAEIPKAGHFPMYSNPVAMWSIIYGFISGADGQSISVPNVTI